MGNELYSRLKSAINTNALATAIFAIKVDKDGKFEEMRYFAINNIFIYDCIAMFFQDITESQKSKDEMIKEIESKMEGELYTVNVPKEPSFEELCYRAAWKKQPIHTYVDTTKMYGFWTEDYMIPVQVPDDERPADVQFCQFSYTLNKSMDTNKFSAVPPDIASFVIKACLELRSENDFYSSMDTVTKYIREFTDSFGTSIFSYQPDLEKFEVISGASRDPDRSIKKIFEKIPFRIVQSWEMLLKKTNSIIIKNEEDMDHYGKDAPEWVQSLRDNGIKTLCLVPLEHSGAIIGFAFISNFNLELMAKIKETIELVSFFLSAEVANHLFLERLEYLSNVDMLTGVHNRNCMNVNVDELALKLEFDPRPFTVAFCDLNGLKTINDNQGHDAGDKLIVAAADVLKEVFADDQIYRAGGDEFAIISTHGTEADFEKKVQKLRELASDPEWLCFAIGYYHDETSGQLRLAMRYADERMYKDKNIFYDQHPEKRR